MEKECKPGNGGKCKSGNGGKCKSGNGERVQTRKWRKSVNLEMEERV